MQRVEKQNVIVYALFLFFNFFHLLQVHCLQTVQKLFPEKKRHLLLKFSIYLNINLSTVKGNRKQENRKRYLILSFVGFSGSLGNQYILHHEVYTSILHQVKY